MRKLFLLFIIFFFYGCSGITPPEHTSARTKTMVVTGYCNCRKCCGWKRDIFFRPVYSSGPNKGNRKKVGITASGKKARKGTIAADTSIYPFGTIMYIDGYGYGIVEDRGGGIKGNHIDIWFHNHKSALAWGKKRLKVKYWLPNK